MQEEEGEDGEDGEDGEETTEGTTEEKAQSLSVVTAKGDDDDDDEYADVEGVVGMVGYPNVGKSSIINVLMGTTAAMHGSTRVRVSATPGKTKHFQTIVRQSRAYRVIGISVLYYCTGV